MSLTSNSFEADRLVSRPLVRRAYQALVAALAVFILVLVLLREPTRGYLGEVQITGPATEAFDLDEATRWLRETDPRVAAAASAPRGAPPRSVIRISLLAPRPKHATTRLDELASRWMHQFLPDRLQAHRQAIVTKLRATVIAAREAEDTAREQLEALRQQQIAHLYESPSAEQRPGAFRDASHEDIPQPAPSSSANRSELQDQLTELRLELARLLATLTDEHPQVIALRSQIAVLEQSAVSSPGGPLLPLERAFMPSQPANRQDGALRAPDSKTGAGHFLSISRAALSEATSEHESAAEMAAATQRVARASRQRQDAEHRLSDRMQELSSAPAATDWSSAPAKIVTRVGGTTRTATLILGSVLGVLTAIVMFRASAISVAPIQIRTTGELATLLEIPVIGDLSRPPTVMPRRSIVTPNRLRWATHGAEAIVAMALAACLLSIAMESSLSWQALCDPFGTLFGVIERLGRH